MFPPKGLPHLHAERKETAGDEEGVEDSESDLKAEVGKLRVDVVKDGAA